jgi:5-methylcytosine-specific restriction protein B
MQVQTLGEILKDMYENAPDGESVAMIHLFGIKFADQIARSGFSPKEIAKAAGIQESYGTEISEGVKLAKYVLVK